MIPNFENPIVETELSIYRKHKELLKQNPNVLVFDLLEPVPIYKHYINYKTSIEHFNAKYYAENILTNITNAYKQFDTVILERMLIEEAEKIKNVCKGAVVTDKMCENLIEKALINNDTIEVKPNAIIRFLTNPFYKRKLGEGIEQKVAEQQNKFIGQKKRKENYKSIYNAITDHDTNKGFLKYLHIKNSTGMSTTTIKNYLNDYPLLKETFDEVKRLSRTSKQMKTKSYNNAKISKRAS